GRAGGGEPGPVRRRDRTVPPGVVGALLSPGRFGARRRGPGAGNVFSGLAFLRRLRGPRVDSVLALRDRHQRLSDRGAAAPDPGAALGPDRSVRRAGPPAES